MGETDYKAGFIIVAIGFLALLAWLAVIRAELVSAIDESRYWRNKYLRMTASEQRQVNSSETICGD